MYFSHMSELLEQILHNRDEFVQAVASSKMGREKKKELLKLCLLDKRDLLETAAHNTFLKHFGASPFSRDDLAILAFKDVEEMVETIKEELKEM